MTETVHGLGGDATHERAIAEIFAAKGRPRFNPLIVHVPGRAEPEASAERSRKWRGTINYSMTGERGPCPHSL